MLHAIWGNWCLLFTWIVIKCVFMKSAVCLLSAPHSLLPLATGSSVRLVHRLLQKLGFGEALMPAAGAGGADSSTHGVARKSSVGVAEQQLHSAMEPAQHGGR